MANEPLLITGASSDIGCALIRHLLSKPEATPVVAHAHTAGSRMRELQAEFG